MINKLKIPVLILVVLIIAFGGYLYWAKNQTSSNTGSETVILGDNEYYLSFDYVDSAGKASNYEDKTKKCLYEPAKAENVDIDSDGEPEIIVSCLRGGSVNGADLYVYRTGQDKLIEIAKVDTEGGYRVEDCNSDGINDIKTSTRADGVLDCDKEKCMEDGRWLSVEFCNSWDAPEQKFDSNQIGVY